MITIKEEKIAEMMFDIWHESDKLKNPVMVGEYIANKLKEAINYTRCCTELKDKEKISFDEWLRVEDIKMHQDGTFYISSERRYVELTFLINRYNSLNL